MATAIFDLDDTLACNNHRIHLIQKDKPDWDEYFDLCHLDPPIYELINYVKHVKLIGHDVTILTGRNDQVKNKTIQWLAKHGIEYDQLLMRPSNSRIPNRELKLQLFKLVKDPVIAFDDMPHNVLLFKKLGLVSKLVINKKLEDEDFTLKSMEIILNNHQKKTP